MNDIDRQYKRLLNEVLNCGVEEVNVRTGAKVRAVPGKILQVNLEEGFPLISLRPIPIQTFVAETLFYLQGVTDPRWMQDFTKIWDAFLAPDGTLPDSYGYRWKRAFGRDQIDQLIQLLRKDPTSRHGVVAMWDPRSDGLMGEPKPNIPCPISFTAQIISGRLNMCVTVRSQDCYLGLPTDVAGFALLQTMLAAHIGVRPGVYSHFICNAHLYENQWLMAEVLAARTSKQLPMPLFVRSGSILEAKYGEKGLVSELVSLIGAKYTPLAKLPKVDIIL